MGGFFLLGARMRDMILNCARRVKKDTTMKRAFLRAIGVKIPKEKYVTINVDESDDIRECFENRERVNL